MRDVYLIDDVRTVRALSHPLRIRILSVLAREGPATATSLGRALEESSGATSYHLRELARYGLIEELDGGNKRDRWWRRTARHYNVSAKLAESEEYRAAVSRFLAHVLEHDAAVVSSFLRNREEYEPRWRDAAVMTNHALYATPEELKRLNRELQQAFARYERPEPGERPPGAMRCYGVLRLVPWNPEPGAEAEADEAAGNLGEGGP